MEWNLFLLLCSLLHVHVYSVYESCKEVILQDRLSESGIYQLTNTANETYEVYCVFSKSQPLGYTFISMKTDVDINIEKLYSHRSFVIIRHIDDQQKQFEVKVEQFSTYSDQANFSFFYSQHPGYSEPSYASTSTGQLNYIYLGFLNLTLASMKGKQGYRAGGQDYDFNNCDASPESYIAFYFNVDGDKLMPLGNGNSFMNGWKTKSEALSVEDYMDTKFYFAFEMHMGKCGGGGHVASSGLGIKASLGLPFDIPRATCDVRNPCLNEGTCRDTENGVICECKAGFSGDTCEQNIQHDTCDVKNPCLNEGTCRDTEDGIVCECKAGFSGDTCEQNIQHDTCDVKDPCLNEGTCRNTEDGVICECKAGFSGDTCEQKQCRCPCSSVGQNQWSQLYSNATKEELEVILKEVTDKIKSELTVNYNTTSSYRRLKTSAHDERRSSQSIGVAGIIFLCLPVLLVVIADLPRLQRWRLKVRFWPF